MAPSRSPRGELDLRHAAQRLARELAQAVALGERPLRVGLLGEEVAPVEAGGARQGGLGRLRLAPGEGAQPLADARLEVVGVDPDRSALELVAPRPRGDEGRAAMLGALGLEPVAKGVHRLAHAGVAPRAGGGPEGLDQLLGRDDALPVGDEVLEDVARPVAQPLSGQRALAAFDATAAKGEDAQLRTGHPVRLGTPAAVAGHARAQLHHDGRLARVVGRGGDPDRGGRAAGRGREVDAHLGQRPAGRERQLGEAVVGERRAGAPAVEEVAAPRALALEQRTQHPFRVRVGPLDLPTRVEHQDAGREGLEDRAIDDRRGQAEVGAARGHDPLGHGAGRAGSRSNKCPDPDV